MSHLYRKVRYPKFYIPATVANIPDVARNLIIIFSVTDFQFDLKPFGLFYIIPFICNTNIVSNVFNFI